MSNSYKQILKSTSIIGGASIINVAFGIIRIKMIAVELGPVGVGIFGLALSIISIGAQIIGLGISSASIRKTADLNIKNNNKEIELNRSSLVIISLLVALIFSLFLLLLEDFILKYIINKNINEYYKVIIISIFLTCTYNTYIAYFTGLNKIDVLAKITIISALTYTFFGLIIFYCLSNYKLATFIVIGPAISLMVAYSYFYGFFKFELEFKKFKKYIQEIKPLFIIGIILMVSGLVGPLGQIIIRLQVDKNFGDEFLGYYQSAINITISYVGFILGAMGVSYYPRLVSVINDKVSLKKIINEQSEIAILLASPILIFIMTFTPQIINILYANGFEGAILITRILILGDVLKILSWPLGIVLLAAGSAKKVLLAELFAFVILIVANSILAEYFGLEAAGISYSLMYCGFLILCYFFIKNDHQFSWESKVLKHAAILFSVLFFIILISHVSETLSEIIGAIILSLSIFYTIMELLNLIPSSNPFLKISNIIKNIIKRFQNK